MNKIRVFLADDHAVLRSGLRLLLSQSDKIEVVGEAESGLDTIRLVEALQPDLILLDLSMPRLGGLDALPTIRRVAPQARILVLTMHSDPQYLQQAIRNGAAGYLLKKAADSELLAAIEAVMRGEVYVHSSMTRALLEDLLPTQKEQDEDAWANLSRREQNVLRLVALGHTGAEIADMLSISQKTVDTYRARGMEKLGLKTRAALVRFALERGILTSD
ncbi:MAG: DNA-binding response regulator [Anaerolineae bacterium]|nr:MAG: DNA-binding response regulator [Anaerolineae bacterium]